MPHAFFKPAGRRSRGCQLRRRLLVPLCLLALTHFPFLFFTASAAGAPMAEAEVAVKEQVIDAKKPPVVKKESELNKPKGEQSLIEEAPVAVAGKKNLSGQQTKWIAAGAVAASAILLLLLFIKIAKHEAEEKRREAVERDLKESLEALADLTHFKNTFKELLDDLANSGDGLTDMNYKVQQLIILANERLAKIDKFEKSEAKKPQKKAEEKRAPKESLKVADLTRFKKIFKELLDDLANSGDGLSDMNYKVQQLIILANERLAKIDKFEENLKAKKK